MKKLSCISEGDCTGGLTCGGVSCERFAYALSQPAISVMVARRFGPGALGERDVLKKDVPRCPARSSLVRRGPKQSLVKDTSCPLPSFRPPCLSSLKGLYMWDRTGHKAKEWLCPFKIEDILCAVKDTAGQQPLTPGDEAPRINMTPTFLHCVLRCKLNAFTEQALVATCGILFSVTLTCIGVVRCSSSKG